MTASLKLLALPVLVGTLLALYLAGSVPYRIYVIHTGSMSPAIPSRSAVLVHQGHYHLGQAISLHEHGLTVTHRLVAFNRDGTVTTQGDADRSVDPWRVPKTNIIGGVVLAPHFVGFAIAYVHSPLGAASLVLAILAVWQTVALARVLQPSGSGARTLTTTSRST
jgi:signal peptidase